jgi:hypothetical protein
MKPVRNHFLKGKDLTIKPEVYGYNPSYLGGGDQENCGFVGPGFKLQN